ncbi:MAG: hypothetical protein ACTS7I_00010 [Candidatus Hodgkinia cicadicola]
MIGNSIVGETNHRYPSSKGSCVRFNFTRFTSNVSLELAKTINT